MLILNFSYSSSILENMRLIVSDSLRGSAGGSTRPRRHASAESLALQEQARCEKTRKFLIKCPTFTKKKRKNSSENHVLSQIITFFKNFISDQEDSFHEKNIHFKKFSFFLNLQISIFRWLRIFTTRGHFFPSDHSKCRFHSNKTYRTIVSFLLLFFKITLHSSAYGNNSS